MKGRKRKVAAIDFHFDGVIDKFTSFDIKNDHRDADDFSLFMTLPTELTYEIGKQADAPTTRMLSRTCTAMFLFFGDKCLGKAAKLLEEISKNQLIQAVELMDEHPELLFQEAKVTDPAGYTFNSITAFQYAVWAYDKTAWKKILSYLPAEEAIKQLEKLNTFGTKHGSRTMAIKRLKIALTDFITVYKSIDWQSYHHDALYKAIWDRTLERYWLLIGTAQRLCPVHVMGEYFHPDRKFVVNNGAPLFNDDEEIPVRTLDQALMKLPIVGGTIYPLQENSGLGYHYALSRADRGTVIAKRGSCAKKSFYDSAVIDLAAITKLEQVRCQDVENLHKTLVMQCDAAASQKVMQ